jgi:hypothetical protein
LAEAESLPDKNAKSVDKNGNTEEKTIYQKRIDQANAQRNRLKDRLHTEKQKMTIH